MSIPANPPHVVPAIGQALGRVPAHRLEPMVGQASARAYWRLHLEDAEPATLVVMALPPGPVASDEGGGGDAPAELPFLSVGRLLAERGVRVPRVYADDPEHGVVLLEDLGDETFEARLLAQPERTSQLYEQAVDTLAALHAACEDLPEGAAPTTKRFDEALFRWELDHFREWGLEEIHGALSEGQRARFDGSVDALAMQLAAAATGFVHRDYQSRNLMWKADELVVIDFQDALQGPRPYDLVALLCDSYVDLPVGLQDAMIVRYCVARGFDARATELFRTTFWRQAVQRKLKDAGRFVYIDRVRGNASFLPSYAPSLRYVGRALGKLGSELAELGSLLEAKIPGFPDEVAQPPAATGSAPDRAF